MVSVQLAPAARAAGQFLARGKSALLIPATPMLLIDSGTVLALVIITVLGLLHLFTTSLPILIEVRDKETTGAPFEYIPVFLKVWYSVPSLSVITTWPVRAPVASGLK